MSTVMYAFRANDESHLAEQIEAVRNINKKRIFREDEELQIFTTSAGIVWRVLEGGYGIKNALWEDSKMFPTCNYDDRTDVPDEDIGNKLIAEEVDQLISSEDYTVVSVG